jgi:hypothetical protein
LNACARCRAPIAAGVRFCTSCGAPAVLPAPGDEQDRPEGEKVYNVFADKVGFVPNVRGRDNVIQGVSILASVVIGAGVGYAYGQGTGALIGTVTGLVGGLILSGAVLAVVGLIRRS